MQVVDFEQPAVALISDQVRARKVLADIARAKAEVFRVPEDAFNQDDLYVHRTDTLELMWHLGSKSDLGRLIKLGFYKVPAGCTFATGMSCRNVGIWSDK